MTDPAIEPTFAVVPVKIPCAVAWAERGTAPAIHVTAPTYTKA
jgi:hypothetical protein